MFSCTFSEAQAKREVFIWKKEHDILLMREVICELPHKFKTGTKERGQQWDKIANNLNKGEMKVTKRSVRERFDKLYLEFKQREREEKCASGIEAEYDELHQALTDIHDMIRDHEGERSEKETKEKAQAEEMRKRATEKLSETKKRNSVTDDADENSALGASKKRRSSQASIVEVMEKSTICKEEEQKDQLRIRERESLT